MSRARRKTAAEIADPEVRYLVPFPPGVGQLYERKVTGRRQTPRTIAFRDWLSRAGNMMRAQGTTTFDTGVVVRAEICCDTREKRCDFGDRRPAIRELLVELGVVTDPGLAAIEVTKVDRGAPCALTIAHAEAAA